MSATGKRAGWSMVEVVVAGGIFAVMSASLVFSMVTSRRSEELTRLYMDVVEASASAIHHIRSDLRHVLVVAGQPLEPGSLRIGSDGRSLRFRRMTAARGAAGWALSQVDYRLVPAARARGFFHLARAESAAAAPSGRAGEVVFRSFLVKSLTFALDAGAPHEGQDLRVALDVAADGSRSNDGPFAGKSFPLTHRVNLRQPEQPFEAPTWFAEMVPMEAEVLSVDVLAAGEALPELSEF